MILIMDKEVFINEYITVNFNQAKESCFYHKTLFIYYLTHIFFDYLPLSFTF